MTYVEKHVLTFWIKSYLICVINRSQLFHLISDAKANAQENPMWLPLTSKEKQMVNEGYKVKVFNYSF